MVEREFQLWCNGLSGSERHDVCGGHHTYRSCPHAPLVHVAVNPPSPTPEHRHNFSRPPHTSCLKSFVLLPPHVPWSATAQHRARAPVASLGLPSAGESTGACTRLRVMVLRHLDNRGALSLLSIDGLHGARDRED
jgi:hypothetical protein